MPERKWSLYRLVITPPDSSPETVLFAAPSDSDALYVVDLHWTEGVQMDLCAWRDGEWKAVEVKGASVEQAEYVTY